MATQVMKCSEQGPCSTPTSHQQSVLALKNLLSIPSQPKPLPSYSEVGSSNNSPSHAQTVKELMNVLTKNQTTNKPVNSPARAQPISEFGQKKPNSPASTKHAQTVEALMNVLTKSPTTTNKSVNSPARNQQPQRVPKSAQRNSNNNQSKTSSPPTSSSESELKNILTGSSKKSNKKKTNDSPSPLFFAGSAFQNSPDPISIPPPNFDDFMMDEERLPASIYQDTSPTNVNANAKTESLLKILNINRA